MMDAFIVYPNAYTSLGHGEHLWKNLLQGSCGLSSANTVYHELFPDNTSKIGALKDLANNDSRLLQILQLIEIFSFLMKQKYANLFWEPVV